MSTIKLSPAALADLRDQAAEIAKAHEFSAHYRNGPHEKTTLRGFATYEAARAAADQLEANSQFGRRSIVYAINRLGSFPCTDQLIAMARELAA